MSLFLVRLGNGRYISRCLVTTTYIDYESVGAREEAFRMTDSDSALVLKTLQTRGQQATRHMVEPENVNPAANE